MNLIISLKMNKTNRQVLPSGLWVVATPIGNLEDLTPRALRALQEAEIILCEDTRRTSVLLAAVGISASSHKLHRLDAHTGIKKIENYGESLQSGMSIALVTDAGTPSISDPGALLVAEAQKKGVRITPIPGVSAVATLISVSGFHGTSFTFRGFFPRKSEEQKQEIELAATCEASQVFLWFESPHRIVSSLQQVASLVPQVETVVGKELTKLHERLFWGDAASIAIDVKTEVDSEGEVGEWCFAVNFPKREKTETAGDWLKALKCVLTSGVSVSDAVKNVSQEFGVSKKMVYEAALEVSGKKTVKGG
jgi:16S rRNA (cytidine1402-2'-O)-methyltransferase